MRLVFLMIADIPPGAESAFQRYESLVLPLLAATPPGGSSYVRTEGGLNEVHIVSFESEGGSESYVADQER